MGIKSFYRRCPVIRELYRVFNAVNELTAMQRSLEFTIKLQARNSIIDHDPRTREPLSLTPHGTPSIRKMERMEFLIIYAIN